MTPTLPDLENINVFLFDINQYNKDTKELDVTVFANFEGKTYIADNIFIYPTAFCVWKDGKYSFRGEEDLEILKIKGGLEIIKAIEEGNCEKFLEE